MFRKKVIPLKAAESVREEIRKSWKTRGYLITFEDEVGASKVAAEVKQVESKAKVEEPKPESINPVVEEVIEEVIEEVKPDLPEDLKCPHCNSKARTEASYIKNHGDKCFAKED